MQYYEDVHTLNIKVRNLHYNQKAATFKEPVTTLGLMHFPQGKRHLIK